MQGHTGDWPHEEKTAIQFAFWARHRHKTPHVVSMPYKKICFISSFHNIISYDNSMLQRKPLHVCKRRQWWLKDTAKKICDTSSVEAALLAPTGLSCVQEHRSPRLSYWQVAIFKWGSCITQSASEQSHALNPKKIKAYIVTNTVMLHWVYMKKITSRALIGLIISAGGGWDGSVLQGTDGGSEGVVGRGKREDRHLDL